MKLVCFNTQDFEEKIFLKVLENTLFQSIQITFQKEKLTSATAILVQGYDGIISFVNDQLNEECLQKIKLYGVQFILLRSAGFNHIDMKAAQKLNLPVYRVPAYSPEAVAEHAVALLQTLNRKIHKAYNRVREMNFSLEGLVGFNLFQKKVGIVGVGKIGQAFARIMHGFGCEILLYDPNVNFDLAEKLHAKYVALDELLAQSDIISIHCPLNDKTHHLINQDNILKLKKNVILVNTSRGAVVQTEALLQGLKTSHIGGAALDVYEFESELFFVDHSTDIIQDDVIARLLTFPNVLITSHQGFLTQEALHEIALVTLNNALDFKKNHFDSKSLNRIHL